jgi:hypothetical protein
MNSHVTSNSSIDKSKSVEGSGGISIINQAIKAHVSNQLSGSSLKTLTSGMTWKEMYMTNPLTAVDMAHLSPSLLLKLLGEPNEILANLSERNAYSHRIQGLIDDLAR